MQKVFVLTLLSYVVFMSVTSLGKTSVNLGVRYHYKIACNRI